MQKKVGFIGHLTIAAQCTFCRKKSTQKNSSKQREEFCDFLSESKQTVVKISVKDTLSSHTISRVVIAHKR